jgi:lipid-A-disaccharide synthase
MSALKQETAGRVRFAGIGGPRMAAEGLDSLFPMAELSLMGLVEVLPHLARIHRRIGETAAAARSTRPDALVTIDAPGFSLRVSRRLKGCGFPLVHYVAPSVWAWKPWRARQLAQFLDLLLTLLPFEPPYFERHGLRTVFVGHPAADPMKAPDAGRAFRADHGIPPEAPLICVLPGSRLSEVRRLADPFGQAVGLLADRHPDLRAVVPTVEAVAEAVTAAVRSWPVGALIVRGEAEKQRAFAASHAALAASGTVSVELAAAGVPAVIGYRVNPLTAAIGRRMATVTHVGLPSLVLGRPVQPELLQKDCTPDKLADAVDRLLSDPAGRAALLADCRAAVLLLNPGPEPAAILAARAVLTEIARR